MKTARKVLLLVLCAALLVSASVMGTLAYLTDNDAVANTMTVGKVEINLDEADVDLYGDEVDGAARVKENDYKLIPGHEYTKDPKVTVITGSEVSYVFVKVENGISTIEAETNTIAAQLEENGWSLVTGETNVYVYKNTVDAGTAAVELPVFSEFTIADDADVAGYEGAKINITAYAIQADGMADADAAWAALNG